MVRDARERLIGRAILRLALPYRPSREALEQLADPRSLERPAPPKPLITMWHGLIDVPVVAQRYWSFPLWTTGRTFWGPVFQQEERPRLYFDEQGGTRRVLDRAGRTIGWAPYYRSLGRDGEHD